MAKAHPYHYSLEKNIFQRLLDIGVPLGLFFLFFRFYNFSKITPSEMVKTSGLLSISLLGITLLAGPLARIIPALDILKAHRKFWGITSFFVAIVHLLLVFIFYYKFNLLKFIEISNPKYSGVLTGLLALVILFLVTMTSSQKYINKLSPNTWKIIQTSSYLAMILAILHFYFMEQKDGVLVIKRLLGQITFGFSLLVIFVRVFILALPGKK